MLVRHQSSREHNFAHVIETLDRVSRAMNPILLFIAVSLVVLNLACVVNLIDWAHLTQSPAENAASTTSALTSAASPGAQVPKAGPAVSSHRLPSPD